MRYIIVMIIFVLISPFLMADWQEVEGPSSGYVRSLVSEDTIVVAATGAGVMVSTDSGESWEFRNNGLESYDTKCIAILGDCIFVSSDENVFRSYDQGNSWEATGGDLRDKYVKTLIVSEGVIYAGTYLFGIYRSLDQGTSWELVNNGIEEVEYIYWLETDGSNLFAGTYLDGIFRSSDQGDTWQAVNDGLNTTDIMSVHSYSGRIFLSTLNNGVFYSDNSGDSWFPTAQNLPSVKGFYHTDSTLYAASFNNGLYRSFDNGENWSTINNGLTETGIWSISGNEEFIFVGMSSGNIQGYSLESGYWELMNPEAEFLGSPGSLCVADTRLIAGTHGSGLYTSEDLGNTWIRRNSINTVEIRSVYFNGDVLLAGTDMLGIYVSSNNGNSFNLTNNGLGSNWIQDFTYFQNNYYAASRDAGVFCWYQGSGTWASANNGILSQNVTSLAHDQQYVYAGTYENGIYRSGDLGNSWEIIADSLKSTCLGADNSLIAAGTQSQGIYISDSQGEQWRQSLNDHYIRSLSLTEDLLICATNTGLVFATDDIGENWTLINTGLPEAPVLSLCIYSNNLWSGIAGNGVFRFPLSQLVCCHYGDIDDNGSIETYDAALILQYVVGVNNIQVPQPWEEWRITTADVDADSEITAYDASLIMRYFVGIISYFPAQF